MVSDHVVPFDEVCQETVPVWPLSVIVALEPAHNVFKDVTAVPPTLGCGFTVTDALAVFTQPLPSVPVTVYVYVPNATVLTVVLDSVSPFDQL